VPKIVTLAARMPGIISPFRLTCWEIVCALSIAGDSLSSAVRRRHPQIYCYLREAKPNNQGSDYADREQRESNTAGAACLSG
jgi:hypothetical protein